MTIWGVAAAAAGLWAYFAKGLYAKILGAIPIALAVKFGLT